MTAETTGCLRKAAVSPTEAASDMHELYGVYKDISAHGAGCSCNAAKQQGQDGERAEDASDPVHRGVFVTFEGGEGAGKTTHISILAEVLESLGREVVRLREPGGTSIGESLRSIVLDPSNKAMCDECELLIYEAARAQIVHEVIAPSLDRGAVVLCDRFYDSTVAYQGGGRGMDALFIDRANAFACQGIRPDRTILLVPPSVEDGLDRAVQFGQADRLESEGARFHERVRAAFATLSRNDPQRVRTVESASAISDTARAVFCELRDLFPFEAFLRDETFFKRFDAYAGRGEKAVFGGGCASFSDREVR